jgi:hypothetical protein
MTVLGPDSPETAGRDGMSESRGRRTIPTQLAALAIGVSESTIRKWASRGKLTRYGRPGRAEYDIEELYRLAEAREREILN